MSPSQPRSNGDVATTSGRSADAVDRRNAPPRSVEQDRVARARESISEVSARDLFVVGVALYWAEGAKDKPWRRSGSVKFTNSDVSVNRVFLAWLDLIGVPKSARRFRLSIHESANVTAQEQWWADALSVDVAKFDRATIKRHNPKPSRYNRNETYHGCVAITIGNPMVRYDAIDGWWTGIAALAPAAVGAERLGSWELSRVV